ncbi:MAG: nitroreductase family protein [Candidatus Scalindua sp.]
MDVKDAIINRRSIRKYAQKKVDKRDILEMLEIAMWSPSACNRQAHKVIYIENDQIKKKLLDYGAAPFIKDVPVLLLFLYDDIGDNITYRDDIQSASAFIENFLLLAFERGFSTCWICQLPSKRKLRAIFNIPKGITPIAAVSIGYPAKKPVPVPRKYKVEEIFFDEILPHGIRVNDRNLNLFFKRVFRTCYYLLPVFIKEIINPYVDKFFVKKFKN